MNTKSSKYKDGKLSDDHIKRLEGIVFKWIHLSADEMAKKKKAEKEKLRWKAQFDELKEYKNKHGDCNWIENNIRVRQWANTQRTKYKDGKLSEDRIKRLEDIGFEWNPYEEKWANMLETLKKYKDEHGDCNLPTKWE